MQHDVAYLYVTLAGKSARQHYLFTELGQDMTQTAKTAAKATASKAKTAAKAAIKPAEKIETAFAAQAREALETGADTMATKAKETWTTMQKKTKDMTEKTTEALGSMKATIETAGAKARDVNVKMIDLVAADASFYFETIHKLAAAKSIKEAVAIQGDYFKTQFQTSVKNMKALGEIAQGAATDTFKPMREKMMAAFPKMN